MISKKRLLLTEDGKVTKEGDPAGVRLLVGAGGIVPDEHVELVKEYLADNPEAEDETAEDEATESGLKIEADESEEEEEIVMGKKASSKPAARKPAAKKK